MSEINEFCIEMLPSEYLEYSENILECFMRYELYENFTIPVEYDMAAMIKIYLIVTSYLYHKHDIDVTLPFPDMPSKRHEWNTDFEIGFLDEIQYIPLSFMKYLEQCGWSLYYEHSYSDLDNEMESLENFRNTPLKIFDGFVDILRETVIDNYCSYHLTFLIYENKTLSDFMAAERAGLVNNYDSVRIQYLLDKIITMQGFDYFDKKEYNGIFFIIFYFGYIEDIMESNICLDMKIPFYIRELECLLEKYKKKGGTVYGRYQENSRETETSV